MKQTLNRRTIHGFGALATATALLVSLLIPTAQANTFSLPNAPLTVTSYIGRAGVVVKWTPGADVAPGVTGYVVSACAGSWHYLSRGTFSPHNKEVTTWFLASE